MIVFYHHIKTKMFIVDVDRTSYPLFDNKRILMTPKGPAINSLKETTINYVRDRVP